MPSRFRCQAAENLQIRVMLRKHDLVGGGTMRATIYLIASVALASTGIIFAQPALNVSPISGPPTDQANVDGTGFGASEAVDIYFDRTDAALATTAASGAFTGIRLNIPATALPGMHWITGVGRQSGLAAQASFLVRADWTQFMHGPLH